MSNCVRQMSVMGQNGKLIFLKVVSQILSLLRCKTQRPGKGQQKFCSLLFIASFTKTCP